MNTKKEPVHGNPCNRYTAFMSLTLFIAASGIAIYLIVVNARASVELREEVDRLKCSASIMNHIHSIVDAISLERGSLLHEAGYFHMTSAMLDDAFHVAEYPGLEAARNATDALLTPLGIPAATAAARRMREAELGGKNGFAGWESGPGGVTGRVERSVGTERRGEEKEGAAFSSTAGTSTSISPRISGRIPAGAAEIGVQTGIGRGERGRGGVDGPRDAIMMSHASLSDRPKHTLTSTLSTLSTLSSTIMSMVSERIDRLLLPEADQRLRSVLGGGDDEGEVSRCLAERRGEERSAVVRMATEMQTQLNIARDMGQILIQGQTEELQRRQLNIVRDTGQILMQGQTEGLQGSLRQLDTNNTNNTNNTNTDYTNTSNNTSSNVTQWQCCLRFPRNDSIPCPASGNVTSSFTCCLHTQQQQQQQQQQLANTLAIILQAFSQCAMLAQRIGMAMLQTRFVAFDRSGVANAFTLLSLGHDMRDAMGVYTNEDAMCDLTQTAAAWLAGAARRFNTWVYIFGDAYAYTVDPAVLQAVYEMTTTVEELASSDLPVLVQRDMLLSKYPILTSELWFSALTVHSQVHSALQDAYEHTLSTAHDTAQHTTAQLVNIILQMLVLLACLYAVIVSLRCNATRVHLDAAEKEVRLRRKFVSYIMHETRVPLNALTMGLDVLAPLVPSKTALDIVASMREGADSMARILTDVLDWEKIESGKLPLELAPMSLHTLIQRAVAMLGPTLLARKLACTQTIVVPPELRTARILGDRHRLRQIIDNVLNNACKFSSPGSTIEVRAKLTLVADLPQGDADAPAAHPSSRSNTARREDATRCCCARRMRIAPLTGKPWPTGKDRYQPPHTEITTARDVSTHLEPGHANPRNCSHTACAGTAVPSGSNGEARGRLQCLVEIEIEDHGIGISSDNQRLLFSPFQQFDAARKSGKGSGLGLAISKQLARSHGGDLTVISQLGRGSTFLLRFPAAIVLPHELSQDSHSPIEQPLEGITSDDTNPSTSLQPGLTARNERSVQHAAVGLASTEDAVGSPEEWTATALIVDDTASNRSLLSRLVEQLGLQAVESDDGLDALQKLFPSPHPARGSSLNSSAEVGDHLFIVTPNVSEEARSAVHSSQHSMLSMTTKLEPHFGHVHIIFLDRHMPGVDGAACAKALRQRGVAVPIIGVTGDSPSSDHSFLEAGVNEVIHKPFSLAQLRQVLEKYGVRHC